MEKSFLINRICTQIHFHFPFHSVCQCETVPRPSAHPLPHPHSPQSGPFRHNLSRSVFTRICQFSPLRWSPACRPQLFLKFCRLNAIKDRRLGHFRVTADGLNSPSHSGIAGVNHLRAAAPLGLRTAVWPSHSCCSARTDLNFTSSETAVHGV